MSIMQQTLKMYVNGVKVLSNVLFTKRIKIDKLGELGFLPFILKTAERKKTNSFNQKRSVLTS